MTHKFKIETKFALFKEGPSIIHIKSLEERLENIESRQNQSVTYSKRIERFDSFSGDDNTSNHWRGKEIIPLNNTDSVLHN